LQAEAISSIWFVYGLFGNREETWTYMNHIFWPNLLTEDFPIARVVIFGYDASVGKFSQLWKRVNKSGLSGYRKNLAYVVHDSRQAVKGEQPIPALDVPIYFIGHSLGGLVIQQALLKSLGSNDSLLPVATRIAGIMFMATLYKGSSLAWWAVKLHDAFWVLLLIWSNNINREVLKLLELKSDICQKV
jgi:pimeloyl-ACP methyl ester carboxylesterase